MSMDWAAVSRARPSRRHGPQQSAMNQAEALRAKSFEPFGRLAPGPATKTDGPGGGEVCRRFWVGRSFDPARFAVKGCGGSLFSRFRRSRAVFARTATRQGLA